MSRVQTSPPPSVPNRDYVIGERRFVGTCHATRGRCTTLNHSQAAVTRTIEAATNEPSNDIRKPPRSGPVIA
ncbi:hypothetical protein EYF80_013742 [Liparis tanakae]|uniref:Uncharacterized protein n=1 Tax=Liparis tanakae TaxID=230148 RepID=A0A4Z2ID21_9TELE|nr:hypothetical protein EYF80_013742 [Liparis tanakae]